MKIEYQIITNKYRDGDGYSYDYDTHYLEHKVNADDLYEFFTKVYKEKVDKHTFEILLDYDFIDDNYIEQDDDFQEFMQEKYEDEFEEQLKE